MFLIVHTVDVEICHGFSIELLQHQVNKLKLFKGYTAANCAFMYSWKSAVALMVCTFKDRTPT